MAKRATLNEVRKQKLLVNLPDDVCREVRETALTLDVTNSLLVELCIQHGMTLAKRVIQEANRE